MPLQFPAVRWHAGAVMLRNEIRARRLETGDKINRTPGRALCGNVCSDGLNSTMTSSFSSVSTRQQVAGAEHNKCLFSVNVVMAAGAIPLWHEVHEFLPHSKHTAFPLRRPTALRCRNHNKQAQRVGKCRFFECKRVVPILTTML